MRDKTSSSEAAWQEEELSAAALPDKRLARRLRRLLDQMSAAPGKPIPAAYGDWAAAKAAYRFFDNPRVTEHSVLAGHFAATAARVVASEGPILILQDTTEFIYSRAQPGKIGFTKPRGRYKAGQPNVLTLCGVLMHSSLAVTLTGTPLGLTAAKFWTRTKFKGTLALKRHINPTRVPIETKESYRWLENLRQSIALVGAPERCVHVGDRESDIYELYCT
ncbi:IS4/Tn5 family transposase DNA-binding protein, partial [Mesorhizobium loti]